MKIGTCTICGENASLYRCEKHLVCDDCGTRDKISNWGSGEVTCSSCHENRVLKKIKTFDGEDIDLNCEVVCPYCGEVQGDSWEMHDGDYDCTYCEREFGLVIEVERFYSTNKKE